MNDNYFLSFFSELRFIVSYVNGDESECNAPNLVDEGIELAVRSPEGSEWVPLAYYTLYGNGKRVERIEITTATGLTSQSVTINIRGYSVPLIQNFMSHTEQVVQICDERFLTSNVQFRWLQSALHSSGDLPRDSWYLDNITLALINGVDNCSTKFQLFDGFDNTTG